MIYVLIWFDVEDYFSADSDDADMRAAEIASRAGVPVTVKVVGEKARALERNDRQDVIQALARHAVGYHSDWHSRPPTIAAYLADLEWEDGAREFEKRERQGFEDVRRIFGQDPVCFGQPGPSWAPQIYPALRKWNIRLYLDEAAHVGLPNEQPFWFQGMLHIFNLRSNAIKMEFGSAADFELTCKLFKAAWERLSTHNGSGLISLYYHPQEFIYRGFSDEVNFGGGTDPSSGAWQTFEQRTASEIRSAYQYYERFLQFIGSFNEVSFINARQALDLYAEPAVPSDASSHVSELAEKVQHEITFHQAGDYCLSAAEIFDLLLKWLAFRLQLPVKSSGGIHRTIGGPTLDRIARPIEKPVAWTHFERAVQEVACFVEEHRQIPSLICVGEECSSPEDFLANLGKAVACLVKQGTVPATLKWLRGTFTAGKYASQDSMELWAWPIFPSNFRAPNLMRLARLQTWTIKPATLKPHLETGSEKVLQTKGINKRTPSAASLLLERGKT
jgi:hypothetical protein